MADEGGYQVHKSGNLAVMSTNNGCKIWDVSEPSEARLLSRINSGFTEGVRILGNTLFVSSAAGFQAWSIVQPESPEMIGSLPLERATICIRDTLAFLKNDFGVDIVNCKDPRRMVRIGEYRFGETAYGYGIYASEKYIYTTTGVLRQLSYNRNGEIALVRTFSRDAWGLSSDGSFLYASTYTDGAGIFNIQNESNVIHVSDVQTGKTWGITHSPGFMYVSNIYGSLTKITIEDVQNPRVVGHSDDRYAAHGIFYDNGLIYAAGTKQGFFILNAEDLSVVFN
jgi:hypothetical protein